MYRQSATTEREGPVGHSTIKQAYVAKLDAFPCHVEPTDSSITQGIPGSFGKMWTMFCPVLDLKEGDKLIVDETDEYRVVGVKTFDFSMNPHCEVLIRAFKE